MKRTKKKDKLSTQMKKRSKRKLEPDTEYDGNISNIVGTGSTLLDLAISGSRIRGGGIPGGIMTEVFGPSSAGKTALLCEIAGQVQRAGGALMFQDPEARLNQQFARMFDLDISTVDYSIPNTVIDVFKPIQTWEPDSESNINGIFVDSLAALSTEMEMKGDDKMGMKRAKDFSEQCRKTCRILTQKSFLLVCSNQVRQNMDAGPYGQKETSPGGKAIGFYSSLRLRFFRVEKLRDKKMIAGKEVKRIVGIRSQIEVFKSSVDLPYRTAPIIISFDYGIDDIQANLQFLKTYTGSKIYKLESVGNLGNSMERAIKEVEEGSWETELREEVIDLWLEIESKFKTERKPKRR